MSIDLEGEAYHQAVKEMEVLKGLEKLDADLNQLQITIKKLNEIVGQS